MSVKCYKCGQELLLTASQNIGRSEECHKCFCDLRCCRMCQFYDPKAYNECREPVAERITDKEKANYCDYFKVGSGKATHDSKENIVKAANSLFKK